MEWYQVLTIVGRQVTCFISFFGLLQIKEPISFILVEESSNPLRREIKDFHGRLCNLEEKIKNPNPKTDP